FPIVAAAGHRVAGADQSAGMLAPARARGVAVALDQGGLQGLSYTRGFDAVMTIDALENVPPEDWPLVIANLRRAVRPGGLLYLTVEEVAEPVIEEAFLTLTRRGQPAVRGEVVDGDVAGYHYYPGRAQVTGWLNAADLQVIDEGFSQEDGWGYRHFLLLHPNRELVPGAPSEPSKPGHHLQRDDLHGLVILDQQFFDASALGRRYRLKRLRRCQRQSRDNSADRCQVPQHMARPPSTEPSLMPGRHGRRGE